MRGSSHWNKEVPQFNLVKRNGLRVCSQVATYVSPWATQPAHPPVCTNHLGFLLWYPATPLQPTLKSSALLQLTMLEFYS